MNHYPQFPTNTFHMMIGALVVVLLTSTSGVGQEPTRGAVQTDFSLIDDLEEGFAAIFNGRDLSGWEQRNGTATYEVVDGTILGRTKVGSPNSFLCTAKDYGDFDLRFDVKVDAGLNSGVQIRSLSKPGFKKGRVHGPQVEIESDPGESGYIYSEGTGRNWISPTQKQRNVFQNDDWNEYRVLADGPRVQTWINGTMIEDMIIPDVESRNGFIGLQVHSIGNDAGPFQVQWQNIRIRELTGAETRTMKAHAGTPVVDGKIDEIWAGVPRILTSRVVGELNELGDDQRPSVAWVRCLWDEGHLYCLAEVTDSKVAASTGDQWDGDGIEFFIDGNMARATSYDADDAQYRTESNGRMSAGASSDLTKYTSKVTKTEDGYLVEARIQLDTKTGKKIGFDAQVNNDPGDGRRMSTMKWNDPTNESYQDTSGFGTLEMVKIK